VPGAAEPARSFQLSNSVGAPGRRRPAGRWPGRLDEAIPILERTLADSERILGEPTRTP
jgi:hypothetical protein